MAITSSDTAFPNNVVIFLKTALRDAIDPPDVDFAGIPVFTRPIRVGDPVQAIAVIGSLWVPDMESAEMMGPTGRSGSPINTYTVSVQTFIQHMDEQEGLILSSTLAGAVRNNLNLNPDIRAGLATLVSTEFGFREVFTRATIQMQRFLSNEIDKQFYHLSNLDLIIETEMSAF